MSSTSRTQYYCAMSLDGYIADVDNSLEWLFTYDGTYKGGERHEGSHERYFHAVGALVMGSANVRGHPP
jgi:dihydrofolate reductase